MNYLDKQLFLTNSFDINYHLILDSSFDSSAKSAIKAVLSRYYHEGFFELKMEDFLELTNSP